jgi:hypothetical protein
MDRLRIRAKLFPAFSMISGLVIAVASQLLVEELGRQEATLRADVDKFLANIRAA